ncbi:MAG: O-antigen ligase family protein [Chloroflexi bacterium]|nr:O-antigen ligase family protein [Chloroflexota bacterium]
MTSSRGAWLSLAAAAGVWGLWLMSGWLARWLKRPRASLFLLGLGLSGAAAILLVLLFPGGLIGLVNRLPGLASGESRWEIYQNTIRLVADYPFTGGGLHSFPGLYSRYILNIPYFLFDYSHNLYLDILLEHGQLGFLAFLGLILGSLWLVLRSAVSSQQSALSSQHSALPPLGGYRKSGGGFVARPDGQRFAWWGGYTAPVCAGSAGFVGNPKTAHPIRPEGNSGLADAVFVAHPLVIAAATRPLVSQQSRRSAGPGGTGRLAGPGARD